MRPASGVAGRETAFSTFSGSNLVPRSTQWYQTMARMPLHLLPSTEALVKRISEVYAIEPAGEGNKNMIRIIWKRPNATWS